MDRPTFTKEQREYLRENVKWLNEILQDANKELMISLHTAINSIHNYPDWIIEVAEVQKYHSNMEIILDRLDQFSQNFEGKFNYKFKVMLINMLIFM